MYGQALRTGAIPGPAIKSSTCRVCRLPLLLVAYCRRMPTSTVHALWHHFPGSRATERPPSRLPAVY